MSGFISIHYDSFMECHLWSPFIFHLTRSWFPFQNKWNMKNKKVLFFENKVQMEYTNNDLLGSLLLKCLLFLYDLMISLNFSNWNLLLHFIIIKHDMRVSLVHLFHYIINILMCMAWHGDVGASYEVEWSRQRGNRKDNNVYSVCYVKCSLAILVFLSGRLLLRNKTFECSCHLEFFRYLSLQLNEGFVAEEVSCLIGNNFVNMIFFLHFSLL